MSMPLRQDHLGQKSVQGFVLLIPGTLEMLLRKAKKDLLTYILHVSWVLMNSQLGQAVLKVFFFT